MDETKWLKSLDSAAGRKQGSMVRAIENCRMPSEFSSKLTKNSQLNIMRAT